MAPITNGPDTIDGTSGDDVIDGLGGDDWIRSVQGNDFLIGGAGRDAFWASFGFDTMIGGTESDTYHINSIFDSVTEVAGVNEGDHDKVNSYISINMLTDASVSGQDIEDLRLVSFEPLAPAAINAVGNALGNYIEGSQAVNTIDGNDGNDTLDGWEGTDTLLGGNGDDVFIVDHASDLLDVIDGGADSNTVKISFNVNLLTLTGGTATPLNWTNIENILLAGTATLSATGNNNVNTLTGNDGANKLTGLGGDDTLDGGLAADSMAGGLGNDTFIVDNTADKVGDLAGQGTDTVMSKVTYVLPTSGTTSEVENLTLTETAAINGTGNALANILTGNISSNKLLGLAGADTIIGDLGGDTLDGGTGIDTLTGGDGSDTYVIDNVLDIVTEALNEGIDKVNATLGIGAAYVLTANVENLTLLGTTGSQTVTGNGLDNTLVGNTSNNTLSGLVGFDVVNGLGGNDVLSSGDDDDTIDGGTGTDTMDGGLGDDTFMVDSTSDVVIEGVTEGKDLVKSTASYSLVGSPNADDLTLIGGAFIGTGNDLVNTITGNALKNTLSGGIGNDSLLGGIGDDIINGGADNDFINGQAGKDTMTGGTGDDTFGVDSTFDIVIEALGEGVDLVESTINYTLGANLENLTLQVGTTGEGNGLVNIITGNANKNILNGFGANDTISGLGGNDTINGGTGDDTMTGGLGDDTFYVDGLLDVVNEAAGQGTEDTVFSAVTYALTAGADEIENLTLTGVAAIDGTGNDYDNTLTGNVAVNTLTGGIGNDGYVVSGQEDLIVEAVGEGTEDTIYSYVTYDLLNPNAAGAEIEILKILNPLVGGGGIITTVDGYGTNGGDTLEGSDFDNVLYGRDGDDLFIESLGNDEYIEINGEGNDTIESKFTYTLASNLDGMHEVENLTLTGNLSINGTGNELNNLITGNTGGNTLDGGTGNDTLVGGAGNDTYIVDNATLDVVTEVGGGIDTVLSSATYNLGVNAAGTENLTLTGSANIDGTGSAGGNTIIGNGAINTLAGLDGNDVYFIRNGTERIIEAAAEGTDIVRTDISFNMNFVANADEVEQIIAFGVDDINITGNDFANTITGTEGDNIINGAGGDDTLDPGMGNDTLIGGAGNDTFIVDSLTGILLLDAAGGGNDTIKVKASYTLVGLPVTLELENITLAGVGAFTATGNAVTNILIGNGSNNTLDGGVGADTMDGGAGNDIMFVDNVGDFIDEQAGAGKDTVFSSVTFDFSANGAEADNLTLTGAAALDGTGNALDNTLTGNLGNNVLSGNAGKDTYIIQNAGDSIVEVASIPLERDIILSSVTHTMEAEVEDMTLTGTLLINGTGNTMDNTLLGNSAVNTLSGMDGDDVLGASTGDTLVGGLGSDTGLTSFTTDLAALTLSGLWTGMENITLGGTAVIHAFGDAAVNTITGNTAANTIDGRGGTDTLIGHGGNDIYIINDSSVVIDEVTEGGGKDLVRSTVTFTLSTGVDDLTLMGVANINGTGNTSVNTIIGNSGDNVLDGDLGADSMAGGLGNDTYVVSASGDKLTDTGGTDLVESAVTWILATGFENLTLTGFNPIDGTGNTGNNIITGNVEKNTIDGGAGLDTMIGGLEDDTYIIDRLTDVITEGFGEGDNDLIMSKLTYSLAAIANVEDLTLTGTSAIHGTGNGLNNIITGNSGSNTLMGGGGDDTLIGGEGKDFLYGGAGGDVFVFDVNSFKAIDVIKDFDALDVIQYPANSDPLYDIDEEYIDYRTQTNGDDWVYVDIDGVRGTDFVFQLIAIIDY